MKVYINGKWFECNLDANIKYGGEIKITLYNKKDKQYFSDWFFSVASGDKLKIDYAQTIKFKSELYNGYLYGTFPIELDFDGKYVRLVYDLLDMKQHPTKYKKLTLEMMDPTGIIAEKDEITYPYTNENTMLQYRYFLTMGEYEYEISCDGKILETNHIKNLEKSKI